jgi:pimeloyl-ACP methyl ester carboxylesterase
MKSQFLKVRSLSPCYVRNLFLGKAKKFPDVEDEVSHTIKSAGYRGEFHKVKTDDGYVLKVHRVLPEKNSATKGSAFLMHGLFRNASDFLASGPNIALAYYLADNGYDVWMGNARGTKHSTEHETLPLRSKMFWNFSFHEIGLRDVSKMLDFMLDHTNELRTFYVGHSQGGSSLLALLSSLIEYNDKIIQAHLMTPAVFMRHSTSPMLTIPAKRAETVMVNK